MNEEVKESIEENPLLKKIQKIIPPTTIRLPSKGIFYKHHELDDEVENGEIILYPMATLDEIIIRSPDMLYQGTAIEKIITRCAPQVKKPLNLFAKDVDYILVMLRKLSYGDNIVVPFTCPTCLEKNPQIPSREYPISIQYFINKSKQLETEDLIKYKIELSNGIVIHLRPSTFEEMLKMYQSDDANKTPEEVEEIIIHSILSVIESVDNVYKSDFIKGWLHKLPISLMKEIINKISDANNWGPDFAYSIKCKDCEHTHDISYILNPVSFFMLPSSLEGNKS